tara:strand:- start:24695 stop:25195 length:501 start_codon:yes stop_codon:yes gene_type:complete
MKKLLLLVLILPITALANTITDTYHVPVISVEPVVKTVRSYYQGDRTTCSTREYSAQSKTDPMLVILGTTVGAGIGNMISKDKALGTGIGAVIGAGISTNSGNRRSVKRVDFCENRVVKNYEDKIIGYDVTFEVDGRMFTTRMKNDPGSQLQIKEVKRIYPLELVR